MKLPHRTLALLVCTGVCLVVSALWACNVPVFRYALERWEPDQFAVTILHRGELTSAQQAQIKVLEQAAENKKAPANLVVRTVDLNGELDEPTKAFVERVGNTETLPWIVAQFPPHTHTDQLAWSGPMTKQSVQGLLGSPMRKEIVKRIVKGDSAVWVLIESGDKAKDDAAAELLKKELKRLQETLQLPEQETNPVDDLFPAEEGKEAVDDKDLLRNDVAVKLELRLSMLRIARDDPVEHIFATMLLNSESDLNELKEPIAIPIFGRGRSYYALAGKGITVDNLEDLNRFLVGACSCQVKQENPGADMLIAAAWDDLISDSAFKEHDLPELTGLGDLVAAGTPASGSDDPETTAPDSENPEPETPATIDPTASDAVTEAAEPTDAVQQSGSSDPATTEPLAANSPVETSSDATEISQFSYYVPVAGVVLLGLIVIAIGTVMMKSRQM